MFKCVFNFVSYKIGFPLKPNAVGNAPPSRNVLKVFIQKSGKKKHRRVRSTGIKYATNRTICTHLSSASPMDAAWYRAVHPNLFSGIVPNTFEPSGK